ncbi:Hypothetical predicted protein [Paramuricea clavata]|uniref:Uncharacterized protein n=1 Tax=Paramuricea clavata TaxID=317549 RepID=A0A7D9EL34_PARCT|nr:Hypothetical predicted protein [Paramuricea clavata]
MENFDSEKPTTEVSRGQSEEDDLFVEVDIDGSNENDDLLAKSSSFLRQLNQSLHTMVGSIMEKLLKRLHEDKTPPAKRKKSRLATETSGLEEVEENQSSYEDTRALCGPSNADSAKSSQTINARLEQDTVTDNCNITLLSEIENGFSQEDDMGPAITEKLATIINKHNCDRLVAPSINPEIWARIDHTAKQLDLRASTNQSNLAKAGVVLAKSTDKLLSLYQKDSKPEYRELITLNTDALALLGHASCEISQRRREMLKPHLNKEYTTLCASHVPVTSLLFGDDLQGQLINIRATNKVSNTIRDARKQYKNTQQWRPRSDYDNTQSQLQYQSSQLFTGQTYDDCAANVIDTTQLIDNLGFIAHPDKSVFIPTHQLDYLGFTLNSKTMQVTITPGKKLNLIETCKELLTKEYPTIREVARHILSGNHAMIMVDNTTAESIIREMGTSLCSARLNHLCDNARATESTRRSSLRDPSDPILANTDMVAESNEHDCPTANCLTKNQGTIIPPQPTQQNIWDMSIVLNHLKQSKIAKELLLKDLTLKLVMLMELLSGQRCQTLQSLSIDSMKLGDDECVFPINKLLKTTKPGSKPLKLL